MESRPARTIRTTLKQFFDFCDLRGDDPASRFARGILFAHLILIGLMLTPTMFALVVNAMLMVFGPSLFSFVLGAVVAAGILLLSAVTGFRFISQSLYREQPLT